MNVKCLKNWTNQTLQSAKKVINNFKGDEFLNGRSIRIGKNVLYNLIKISNDFIPGA